LGGCVWGWVCCESNGNEHSTDAATKRRHPSLENVI
jgi:hypothetical protein